MLILLWKILFLFLLISGSILSISSSSWFMAWVGLEVNMLAILALFLFNSDPRCSESTLKYFLIQSLASILFLMGILGSSMTETNIMSSNLWIYIVSVGLLMKLGAAPFHSWVPQIIEGMSWQWNFIILSWQKLAPLSLLFSISSFSCMNKNFLLVFIFLSALMGSFLGLSFKSLRKMIAFSSINHMGWILAGLLVSSLSWIQYFIMYCFILMMLIVTLYYSNLSSLDNNFSPNFMLNMNIIFLIMSLGGMPPLLGFAPKLFLITDLMNYSYFGVMAFLIISSLISLFFYLRISYKALTNSLTFYLKNELNSPTFLQLMFVFNALSFPMIIALT